MKNSIYKYIKYTLLMLCAFGVKNQKVCYGMQYSRGYISTEEALNETTDFITILTNKIYDLLRKKMDGQEIKPDKWEVDLPENVEQDIMKKINIILSTIYKHFPNKPGAKNDDEEYNTRVTIPMLNQTIDNLNKKHQKLEKENQIVLMKIKNLTDNNNSIKIELEKNTEQLSTKKKEITNLKNSINQFTNNISVLKAEVKKTDEEVEKLRIENKNLQLKININTTETKDNEIVELKIENEKLKNLLEAQKILNSKLIKDNQSLSENKKQQKIKKFKNDFNNFDQNITKNQKENKEMIIQQEKEKQNTIKIQTNITEEEQDIENWEF